MMTTEIYVRNNPYRTYTNRRSDEFATARMERVLDALYRYAKIGFYRTDANLDVHGVDVILSGVGKYRQMMVDEKCAIKYWDKELTTYSCELTCSTNKAGDGYGWFAQENNDYMRTTHYAFVWLKANDSSLRHVNEVELVIVSKHDLQAYFQQVCNPEGRETKALIGDLLRSSDRVTISEDVKLVRCTRLQPEEPVNVLFSKALLMGMATASYHFTEKDINTAVAKNIAYNRNRR